MANRRKDAGSAHELQKLPGLFSPGSVINGFRALRELAGGERSHLVVPLVVGGLEKCADGMDIRHLCQVSCDSPPADPGNRTHDLEKVRGTLLDECVVGLAEVWVQHKRRLNLSLGLERTGEVHTRLTIQ